MEFNEKLQELRKQKGITQEELAKELFVSRTAVSKWESGRGYPSIDSLKAIAKFFSVTLDELLSTGEVLNIAEEDEKKKAEHFCNIAFALLDIFMALLLFLPLFANREGGQVQIASLLSLVNGGVYLKAVYFVFVALTALFGVLVLAMQNCGAEIWVKMQGKVSLLLGALDVVLFTAGLHPYAAIFAFILLAIKVFLLIKKR